MPTPAGVACEGSGQLLRRPGPGSGAEDLGGRFTDGLLTAGGRAGWYDGDDGAQRGWE
ncbi:MAG: hypothetical protein KGS61_16190 [Verrucomicrobia bacterium]|nr:hypothetical protein [Verrucomicrobiota bacterium]